jgi:phage repressor protein C with HTH and peptisase S24 domain
MSSIVANIVENIRRVNGLSSKSFDAQNFRRPGSLLAMAYDPAQRRRALKTFMVEHGLQPKAWCRASGLSETSLWPFMNNKTQALGDDTYELLASGASKLKRRKFTGAMIRDEPPVTVEIPLQHYVGAGDIIHIVEGDGAFDYTDAPPGFEKGAAGIVRGDSMLPMFDDGDVIFWRHLEHPPRELPRRAVIVKVKDGPLFLKKLLPGTKRGRYHLVSINPITPTMIDQPIEAIARIGWVRPSGGD